MSKIFFVSDVNLIIKLLYDHSFYGSYTNLYSRPVYEPEKAGTVLAKDGFKASPEEYEKIAALFIRFKIEKTDLIPDILLFQKIILNYYNNLKKKKIVKDLHRKFHLKQEREKLKSINEIIDNKEDTIEKFQIIFRTGEEVIIENIEVIDWIVDQLKRYITEKNYLIHPKSSEHTDDEKLINNLNDSFPNSSQIKESEKINARKKASKLLMAYIFNKEMFNMSSESKKITNKAAEFIGWVFSQIDLMDLSVEEFSQNKFSKISYHSYSNYLKIKISLTNCLHSYSLLKMSNIFFIATVLLVGLCKH